MTKIKLVWAKDGKLICATKPETPIHPSHTATVYVDIRSYEAIESAYKDSIQKIRELNAKIDDLESKLSKDEDESSEEWGLG